MNEILKILGIIVSPILLFGGVWLTVRQGRKQHSEDNQLTRWDRYTDKIEKRLTLAELKADVLDEKNDDLRKMNEREHRLRLVFQDYTQRTFNHYKTHPKCEKEIGELAQAGRECIDI